MRVNEVIHLIKTARGWLYEYKDVMKENAFEDQGEDPEGDRENLKLVIKWVEDAERNMLAAEQALRSYQYGNASTELAKSVADSLNAFLND